MQTNLVEVRVGRSVTRLLLNWWTERFLNGTTSQRVPYIRAVKLAVKLFMVFNSVSVYFFWIKK